MVKRIIIISDANIFIDLLSVGLLEAFFALPYEICTTDLLLNEVKNKFAQIAFAKFQKLGKLKVECFNMKELATIHEMFDNCGNNASVPDISVWYYAKKVGGLLLTGDKKLRSIAERDGVKVAGIIYVYERMVEHGILSQKEADETLVALMEENPRLPRQFCEQKLSEWRASPM